MTEVDHGTPSREEITAVTCWIGALASIGTPFLSGFYSKDVIVEAAKESHRWGHDYAYWCVFLGVFVTALYTFRMMFLTFHGPERFRQAARAHHHDDQAHDHGHGHGAHEPHESPAVVTVPLILLAIPSIAIGALTVGWVLFGDYFGNSIFVLERNDVIGEIARTFHGALAFGLHAFTQPTLYMAAGGVLFAYLFFLRNPTWADAWEQKLRWLHQLLTNKYYFDWINENVIARLARGVGIGLWKGGDEGVIDGVVVNGSARGIGWVSGVVRQAQSGYLYHYAFAMIIGLSALLAWLMLR